MNKRIEDVPFTIYGADEVLNEKIFPGRPLVIVTAFDDEYVHGRLAWADEDSAFKAKRHGNTFRTSLGFDVGTCSFNLTKGRAGIHKE